MKSGYLFAWLGILTLLAITCQAQPQRGRNRGYVRLSRDTLFRLLEMPPVRKELELRKLQIDMLDDLQADLGQQRRAAFFSGGPLELPGGRRGPEGSGQALQDGLDKMQAEVEKIRVQGEKLVTVILDSGQTNRLSQVRLQYEGTRALDRREFRDQLGVTDEQFKKIQELRRTEDDPSPLRRRQKKLDEPVLALLNQGQQVKFKELQGEAFEFPLPLPADLRGLRDPQNGNRRRRPPRR
ncbi:MAG: hypothetical protein QF918_00995 [Pirellulaceae bacterium]|nr:hypothetical protein [Pirellulaceae bacterium]MDP6555044.1 hypothetical protein [Pirellulaceae bacterium]